MAAPSAVFPRLSAPPPGGRVGWTDRRGNQGVGLPEPARPKPRTPAEIRAPTESVGAPWPNYTLLWEETLEAIRRRAAARKESPIPHRCGDYDLGPSVTPGLSYLNST